MTVALAVVAAAALVLFFTSALDGDFWWSDAPRHALNGIFLKDVIPFVERLGPGAYDIAYCDPPYGSKKLDRVVARWLEVPFATVLVVEHAPDHAFGASGTSLRVDDSVVTILGSGLGSGSV